MNPKKLIVPVLCVLLGCAGGAAMGTVTAQTWPEPANVQRWQQECIHFERSEFNTMLSEPTARGNRGWELVAAVSYNANDTVQCYRRSAP